MEALFRKVLEKTQPFTDSKKLQKIPKLTPMGLNINNLILLSFLNPKPIGLWIKFLGEIPAKTTRPL